MASPLGGGEMPSEGSSGAHVGRHVAQGEDGSVALPSRKVRERCHVEGLLGQGSYGDVWLCRDRATGLLLACKVVQKAGAALSAAQEHEGPGALESEEEEEEVREEVRGKVPVALQRRGGVQEEEEEREEEGKGWQERGNEDGGGGSTLLKEEEAMGLLGLHPGVVRLLYIVETRTTTQLMMEYCRGGDLFDLIERNGPMPEPAARVLFTELASSLAVCHSRRVLHRDIKPENILLDEPADAYYNYSTATYDYNPSLPPCDTSSGTCHHLPGCHVAPCHALPRVRPKIADFGLAVYLRPGDWVSGPAGSEQYCSPEVLKGELYCLTADVWPLGLVLYALLTGRLPMEDAGLEGEGQGKGQGDREGDVVGTGREGRRGREWGEEGDVSNASSKAGWGQASAAQSFVSDDDVLQDLGGADLADSSSGSGYAAHCVSVCPAQGEGSERQSGEDLGSHGEGHSWAESETNTGGHSSLTVGSHGEGYREGLVEGHRQGFRGGHSQKRIGTSMGGQGGGLLGERGQCLNRDSETESRASSDECVLEVTSLVSEDDVIEESAAPSSPDPHRGIPLCTVRKGGASGEREGGGRTWERQKETMEGPKLQWEHEQVGDHREGVAAKDSVRAAERYPVRAAERDPVWSWDINRGIDFERVQWGNISHSARDLIQRMLEYDAVHRLQSFEVVAHPWVAGGEGEGEGEGSEGESEGISFSPYPLSSTTSSEHSSGEIFPILPGASYSPCNGTECRKGTE